MIINTPEPEKHILEIYDFWFGSGQVLSIQVDKVLGDSIDFDTHPSVVRIHLSEKPHRTNPDTKMNPEDITIFLSHILTISKKTIEVTPLTTEQQMQWQKTAQEIFRTTKVM